MWHTPAMPERWRSSRGGGPYSRPHSETGAQVGNWAISPGFRYQSLPLVPRLSYPRLAVRSQPTTEGRTEWRGSCSSWRRSREIRFDAGRVVGSVLGLRLAARPRRAHHERQEVGGIVEPLVDAGQVRSAGRAAQPGTSARRSGTGRTGACTACRRPRAGAATSACTAAGAAAAAVSFSEALARRSGTAGRAHTSLAGQEQRHRCRDRARSRARRSGRGLGSVRRQHLEPRRDRAARHTAAARETAGDCHERTRRSDDGEVI